MSQFLLSSVIALTLSSPFMAFAESTEFENRVDLNNFKATKITVLSDLDSKKIFPIGDCYYRLINGEVLSSGRIIPDNISTSTANFNSKKQTFSSSIIARKEGQYTLVLGCKSENHYNTPEDYQKAFAGVLDIEFQK